MVDALENGTALRACRANLLDAGFDWKLRSGALIFVHPEQYVGVMEALGDTELKPYHVIVSSSFEYLLEEAIMDIGKGASVKARSCIFAPQEVTAGTTISAGSHEDLVSAGSNCDSITSEPL